MRLGQLERIRAIRCVEKPKALLQAGAGFIVEPSLDAHPALLEERRCQSHVCRRQAQTAHLQEVPAKESCGGVASGSGEAHLPQQNFRCLKRVVAPEMPDRILQSCAKGFGRCQIPGEDHDVGPLETFA